MAATQILATNNTAADSADVPVTAATTVSLKGVTDSKASVIIKLKDDGGAYVPVGSLSSSLPCVLIVAPGTYRFTRVAGATCGVFSA